MCSTMGRQSPELARSQPAGRSRRQRYSGVGRVLVGGLSGGAPVQ